MLVGASGDDAFGWEIWVGCASGRTGSESLDCCRFAPETRRFAPGFFMVVRDVVGSG